MIEIRRRHDEPDAASSHEARAVVEWRPVELEHLRVSRTVRSPLVKIEDTLHVSPDFVLRLAYGNEVGPDDAVVGLTLHPLLPWLRVPVHVESFTPRADHHDAVISIRWRAARFARAFPTMEGDFFLHPGGHDESELALEASYRPPLGFLGLVLDRLVGRWIAGLTARTFLDRIGDYLEASVQTR
jgi:hypothetical protein